MTLIEVENLSAAQLKERRAELIEAIKGADPAELAERFVAAREDAKLRDERLGEQGETIKALKQGLTAATDQATALQTALAKERTESKAAGAEIQRLTALLQTQRADIETALRDMNADLKAESEKSARLLAALARSEGAINAASKALNDAIAARLAVAASAG